jgi:hypothetical protein
MSSMAVNGRLDNGSVVDPDGTVHSDDGTVLMQLAPDGMVLVRGEPISTRINVSNPRVRRCAMYVFYFLYRKLRC